MTQTNIYTDLAYWVIPGDDGFSVEVVSSENHPTTVSPFATASEAKAWIAEHREQTLFASREPALSRPRHPRLGRVCCFLLPPAPD
jgi:hypothetical protein